MKLNDLRRAAVKQNVRVRFSLANGMECLLNEHGVAQIPTLKTLPEFNLEEEFARVEHFVLESAVVQKKGKVLPPQRLNREQLTALVSGAPAAAEVHDHDDE